MSLGAKVAALFGRRAVNISPAVSGKSTWDFANDGPLNLSTAGSWTITPLSSFLVQAKVWGAGGRTTFDTAGAGGYATGYVLLVAGVPYTLYVGNTGSGSTGGSPGGGTGGTTAQGDGGPGGGYSGLQIGSTPVLIAGGGGGGGIDGVGHGKGGAGGGSSGQAGDTADGGASPGGGGGTQVGGGAAGGGNGAQAGSSLQGGAAGNFGNRGGAGGGGGYFGGGGSGSPSNGRIAGGGGGSAYANPQYVVQSTLTAGNYATPGNSADSDRGTAGNPDTAGRVKLT